MEIKIVKGDITNFKGDAIVSPSNTRLKAEGGLSGAIFKKAGYEQLQQDCNKLAPVDVGNAVITKGYNLKVKYIIHTPGPIYSKIANPEKYLARSYYNSLLVAKDNNINTIAFPSISTGTYGFPLQMASIIALKAINDFDKEFENSISEVYLYAFDDNTYMALTNAYKNINNKDSTYNVFLNSIKEYINKNKSDFPKDEFALYDELEIKTRQRENYMCLNLYENLNPESLKKIIKSSYIAKWNSRVLDLIDEKGYKPSEVYKRAGVSKQIFSLIGKSKYSPSKETAIKICIGLKLTVDESQELLKLLGYILSNSVSKDLVVKYCLENKIYDIYKINNFLYSCDLQPFTINS